VAGRTKFEDLKVDLSSRTRLVRLLIYGDTGVGKTFLAASAADVPEMRPVLFCDCDEGLLTVRNRLEHITYVAVRSFAQMLIVTRRLRSESGLPEPLANTLVIDNLSELYHLQLDSRVKKVDTLIPELRDWQDVTNRTRRLLRSLKRLDMHLIVTAPANVVRDETSGALFRTPELPGKLAWQLGRYFDIVGYLTVTAGRPGTELVRQMQVQPYRRIIAKDRSGNLTYIVENPTMQSVYNAIYQGEGGK